MAFRKKVCWSCLTLFVVILSVVGLLVACNDTKFEELKNIPTIEQKEYTKYRIYKRQDLGKRFGHQLGHNSAKLDVPTNVGIMMLDGGFREVDYFFFRKFNNWFEDMQFHNGIMAINQNETLDCDNFAMLYKSLMSVSSYKSNVEHEPAVALVIVEQRHSFGGVPAGSLHMLNLVFTNKAWYIFEPQTGEYIELENYPNQKYIRTIII
jgi:hypothetical protein